MRCNRVYYLRCANNLPFYQRLNRGLIIPSVKEHSNNSKMICEKSFYEHYKGKECFGQRLKCLLNGKIRYNLALDLSTSTAGKYKQAFKQTDCIYKRFCLCSTITKCLYFSSSYNDQKYGKRFVSLSSAGTKNPNSSVPQMETHPLCSKSLATFT